MAGAKAAGTQKEAGAVAPRSGAVHCDPAQAVTVENAPLPQVMSKRPVRDKSPAEWAYDRLILYIQNFEAQLDAAHEVAMGFTGGAGGVLQIEGVGYFEPDLVTFYGRDEDGLKTQMIQHVSQLNVILRAVPKESPAEPPRRIGFTMMQQWAGGESGDASA
ncbi:hypothetical protein H7F16_04325 [Gemmobacter straminiformis]|uniref:Uncharacterized protein n=1 Tax=Paragemmobacter straminiformis TaxID=2045119 RepID=A0A842I530_9RHOB|nr:hypothetical protein [Gemmobacter straminiformis]